MFTLFKELGRHLGVGIAILLVLSTAYDYSFLLALNLSFDEVPTTLSDHVRSAIVWLPKALICILILALFEMGIRWLEDGQTEEEIIANSPSPRFFRAFRNSPKYLFGTFIVTIVLLQLYFTNSLQMLYLVGMFLWMAITSKIVQHKRLGSQLRISSKRLLLTFPALILWVGYWGYADGEGILNTRSAEWRLRVDNGEGLMSMDALGIRRFETISVIVKLGGEVTVVDSDVVKSSELLYVRNVRDTKVCRWLRTGCRSPIEQ